MRLFYDTLVPYMPDTVLDADGKTTENPAKLAGRKAMIELANFQKTGNVNSLFYSTIHACTYAGVDLVDTILGIPDEISFKDGTTVDQLLDTAAKLLFKSIRPSDSFDINLFVANVLTAAHVLMANVVPATETDKNDT